MPQKPQDQFSQHQYINAQGAIPYHEPNRPNPEYDGLKQDNDLAISLEILEQQYGKQHQRENENKQQRKFYLDSGAHTSHLSRPYINSVPIVLTYADPYS